MTPLPPPSKPVRLGLRTCACTCLTVLAALGFGQGAVAQTLAMAGSMGSRAVLVIDGRTAVVEAGSSVGGLRVRSVEPNRIELDTPEGRRSVALGQQPIAVGQGGGGSGADAEASAVPLVLTAASDRVFRVEAQLNGLPVSAVVDTGASLVTLSLAQARRLGLDLNQAPRLTVHTANGSVSGWKVVLNRVRLERFEVRRVDAVVVDTELPAVLLGHSFLSSFRLQTQGTQMQLARLP